MSEISAKKCLGASFLSVGVAFAAGLAVHQLGHGGIPLASAVLALTLLVLPFFLLGLTDFDTRLQRWLVDKHLRRWGLMATFVVPYLVYGWGTGTFSLEALSTLAAFVFLPAILLASSKRASPNWWDGAALLAIWLPFDLRWLEHIWEWPDGLGSYGINAVLAVDLAVILFVCVRGWSGVGYRFRFRRADLSIICMNFLLFAAVAIPLGLVIGFIELHLRWPDLAGSLGSFIGIFGFVALPEELLFRGLIQNSLEKVWGRNRRTLLLAALMFGAAHLNNPPAPSWEYFLLASIAGIFYGRAYVQSGGLMAPAALHALVDTVWRAFFR